jgi:hypothetical protein
VELLSKNVFWEHLKEEISLDRAEHLALLASEKYRENMFAHPSDMFDVGAKSTDLISLYTEVSALSQLLVKSIYR